MHTRPARCRPNAAESMFPSSLNGVGNAGAYPDSREMPAGGSISGDPAFWPDVGGFFGSGQRTRIAAHLEFQITRNHHDGPAVDIRSQNARNGALHRD